MIEQSKTLPLTYQLLANEAGWTVWGMTDGTAWLKVDGRCVVLRKTGDPMYFAAESFLSHEFSGPFTTLDAAKTAAMLMER